MKRLHFRSGLQFAPRTTRAAWLALMLLAWARVPAEVMPPTPVGNLPEKPMVAQFSDGTLAGVLLQREGTQQFIAARFSSDNGDTWTSASRLFEIPEAEGLVEGYMIMIDRGDNFHCFYLNNPNKKPAAPGGEAERPPVGSLGQPRLDIWHAVSSDRGATWTTPRCIWEGYTGALNSIIQLKSGRILVPFSLLTDRSWWNRDDGPFNFSFNGQYDCTLVYSDDDGATWHESPARLSVVVPDIVSAYGAVEPVVLELKDGRVWMLIRTQMGRFYESFSEDGVEWSAPRPTQIVSSDSPAGLVRLTDGRIVLFWNKCQRFPYAYGGRHVLHAAISDDEGRTWRGHREVARDPLNDQPPPAGGDFGTAYPFPIATLDGKAIYYTGQGEGRVDVMRLDPDWLLERSAVADYSTGLTEWSTFGTKGVSVETGSSDAPDKHLKITRPDADWAAGAVWNFPLGARGELTFDLLLPEGSRGATILLADHFSPPFDAEDEFYSLFNLNIGADGTVGNSQLAHGNWHTLRMNWDVARRECVVQVDGQEAAVLPLRHEAQGVCYIRFKTAGDDPDPAGLRVGPVKATLAADDRP